MRFLVATFALCAFPGVAFAQAWTVGDQGANWATPAANPATATAKGSAPADAYEPAEVTLPVTESQWLINTGDQLAVYPASGNFLKGPTRERKIRLTCEPSTAKQKDNILGKGVTTFGHLHQGYGAVNWDENSDYTSLRTSPSSTCTGGPLNATNYMEPALQKTFPNGLVAVVRAQDQADYYTNGSQNDVQNLTWLRRGMQFLVGANPKNFNDTARRAVYDAAGFAYPNAVNPAGIIGWYCVLSNGNVASVTNATAQMQGDSGAHITTKARYLRGPNGEDPWGGTCTGTLSSPAQMVSDLVAPDCWDRYNLTSPDGRGHLWYSARKWDNSVTGACPKTTAGSDYAHVPQLEVKNIYYTTGFSDYGTWFLSSDRMDPALTVTSGCTNNPTTQADSCSISPCRSVGPYFCNGETLHADYTFGWKTTNVFDNMQRECLGITVRGVAPVDGPAECNASQVDRTHALIYTGTSPNSAYSGGCTTILACYNSTPSSLERYNPLPAGTTANVTIHHVH